MIIPPTDVPLMQTESVILEQAYDMMGPPLAGIHPHASAVLFAHRPHVEAQRIRRVGMPTDRIAE
jgi:hypothetical protein